MKKTILMLALAAVSTVGSAQNLTPAQKQADFRYLASVFSVYYAPVDWKKQAFDFDVLSIQPWLDRVAQTTTDLDFYDLCVQYVASLNDTHDSYSLRSDFIAQLGFTTDVYDGVLLIDSLNRTLLPSSKYPFTIGDELVSIDGRSAQDLLQDRAKYVGQGNPIAAKRIVAGRLTSLSQSVFPHAPDVQGKMASVVIRRQNGNLETYVLPWVSTGTPLQVGPVPSPKSAVSSTTPRAPSVEPDEPDYMTELRNAQWSGVLNPDEMGVNGYGGRNPIFVSALSGFNFTQRLGTSSSDFFYSGTFKRDELTIGYIRIPNYAPSSTTTQLQVFQSEIAYMNANTDGLIVDEMRNTGGNLCFGEDIVSRLVPHSFRATGFALRPFWSRVLSFYNSEIAAKTAGASQQIIEQYEQVFNAMLAANRQGQTVTDPLPLCTSSLTRPAVLDASGNPVAYQKTMMLLMDEFSTSTADSVASMIRDANRAVLFGMRTNGAGGNNTTYNAGSYSEGATGMTLAMQVRGEKMSFGYPFSDIVENIGVWPDIPFDYMTRDNLLQNGAPFVNTFLSHMATEIRARK